MQNHLKQILHTIKNWKHLNIIAAALILALYQYSISCSHLWFVACGISKDSEVMSWRVLQFKISIFFLLMWNYSVPTLWSLKDLDWPILTRFMYQGANKKNEQKTLMCHQCCRNNRSGVVICSNCKRKRYCYECLAKW